MTIAVGVMSIDGIAVAADTKESYGDTHTYVDKLISISTENCKGAIAGSGSGYLLDYMCPRIHNLAANSTNVAEFEQQLAELMAEIYNSAAIKSYPIEKTDDLYTQFLVAVRCREDSEVNLFIVNSTLVTKTRSFGTVIGCGPLRQVGEEFGQVSPFDIENAKEAALCIVYEAKRRYSDVGGATQVLTLTNDGILKFWADNGIPAKEALLDRVREMTNLITVNVLSASISMRHFNGIMQNAASRLRDYHKEAQKIEREAGALDNKWFKRMYKKGERQHLKRIQE